MKAGIIGKRTVLPLLILAAAVFLVVYPFFRPGFIETDDGDWMVIRLTAFYQSLTEGQFPVRFLGRLNYNFGYPVSNFLYPGYLYLGSVLRFAGFSFVTAVETILAGSVFVFSLAVYFWLQTRFSRLSALAGSLVAVLSPYLAYDLFKRGSVGEVLVMAVAALVLLAVQRRYLFVLPAAVAFLLLAHNSLALMFLVFLGSYAWLLWGWGVWPHFLVGIAGAAFFWLPALAESRHVVFFRTDISDPFAYFVYPFGRNLFSPVVFFSLLCLVFFRWKKTLLPERYLAIWVGASLFLATVLSAPFWAAGIMVKLVQFPYRFLSLETLLGGYLVALLIEKSQKKFRPAFAAVMVFSALVSWFFLRPEIRPVLREEGFYTTNEATTTVAGEYMPRWVKTLPSVRPSVKAEIIGSPGTVTQLLPGSDEMNFTVTAENDAVFRINKIFYPGWGIRIDGIPQTIRLNEETGMMEIDLKKGSHTVQAAFRETPSRFLADLFSLFSLIGYYAFILYRKAFQLKKNRQT